MKVSKVLTTVALATAASFGAMGFDEIPFKTGDSVAFLGDSITEHGVKKPMGYVNLVVDGLKRAHVEVKMIPAGVSGNMSNHMLARIDKDVIEKKPQWMFLSCGVNDAPNGIDNPGIPLEQYQKNICAILDKCAAANIKVIILTATPVVEEPEHVANKNLVAYNEALRKIAKERNLPLIDVNKRMNVLIAGKRDKSKRILTIDGTHLSPLGNIMMAKYILQNVGLTQETIYMCELAWNRQPNAIELDIKVNMSLQQKQKLDRLVPRGKTTEQWAQELILKQLK